MDPKLIEEKVKPLFDKLAGVGLKKVTEKSPIGLLLVITDVTGRSAGSVCSLEAYGEKENSSCLERIKDCLRNLIYSKDSADLLREMLLQSVEQFNVILREEMKDETTRS